MNTRRKRGNSIIEFSLMTPWLIFMFIGAMDWGFYAYALIATEAAARVACLYTSTSAATATDSTSACTYALGQLRMMPNVGTAMSSCSGPVTVTTTLVASGRDTNPAAEVTVTYLTPLFIPVILKSGTVVPQQVTMTSKVQMRLRG
jgi:Flp pilus assembly protein TadG